MEDLDAVKPGGESGGWATAAVISSLNSGSSVQDMMMEELNDGVDCEIGCDNDRLGETGLSISDFEALLFLAVSDR